MAGEDREREKKRTNEKEVASMTERNVSRLRYAAQIEIEIQEERKRLGRKGLVRCKEMKKDGVG